MYFIVAFSAVFLLYFIFILFYIFLKKEAECI